MQHWSNFKERESTDARFLRSARFKLAIVSTAAKISSRVKPVVRINADIGRRRRPRRQREFNFVVVGHCHYVISVSTT
jgi:hypothetical protein